MPASRYACPYCQSENTQSLEMAYMTGTSRSTGYMVGGGVTGDGFGVGAGATGGLSQTDLAAKVAPPEEASILGPFLGCVMVGLFLWFMEFILVDWEWLGRVFAFLGVMAGFGAGYWAYEYNKYTLPEAKREYNRSYICYRCGRIFKV